MSDPDAFLAGIVAEPANALRWLVMADWLEENGQPERAELVRVHRELLRTGTAAREPKARPQLHARVMELLRGGAEPCLPRRTLELGGGVGLPMVFVPPGSFPMGSPKSEKNRQGNETRHVVTLTRGFFVGVSPVTQAQWVAVMGENPSDFKGDELPVETVSWDDAVAFCGKVTALTGVAARLPSEAEWEYACRAGTDTPFHWGGTLNGAEANCNGNYPYGAAVTGPFLKTTTAVGSYAGVSPHPWGLVDVHGNVWEWCADWFEEGFYAESPTDDPVGPESGSFRVHRGGDWGSSGAWSWRAGICRAAYRSGGSPDGRDSGLGFRLAAGPYGQ